MGIILIESNFIGRIWDTFLNSTLIIITQQYVIMGKRTVKAKMLMLGGRKEGQVQHLAIEM